MFFSFCCLFLCILLKLCKILSKIWPIKHLIKYHKVTRFLFSHWAQFLHFPIYDVATPSLISWKKTISGTLYITIMSRNGTADAAVRASLPCWFQREAFFIQSRPEHRRIYELKQSNSHIQGGILIDARYLWRRDSRGARCHLHVIYNEGKQSGRLCVTPLHSDVPPPLQSATAQYQHLLPSDSCGDLINCKWRSPHSDNSALPLSLGCSSFDRYARLIPTLQPDLWKHIWNVLKTCKKTPPKNKNKPSNTHTIKAVKTKIKTKTVQKWQ